MASDTLEQASTQFVVMPNRGVLYLGWLISSCPRRGRMQDMTRYSHIIIDRLSSLGSDNEIRRTLVFLKECGYKGIELNLTEPPGVNLNRLEQ